MNDEPASTPKAGRRLAEQAKRRAERAGARTAAYAVARVAGPDDAPVRLDDYQAHSRTCAVLIGRPWAGRRGLRAFFFARGGTSAGSTPSPSGRAAARASSIARSRSSTRSTSRVTACCPSGGDTRVHFR